MKTAEFSYLLLHSVLRKVLVEACEENRSSHTHMCVIGRGRTSHTPKRVIFWPVWQQLCLLAKSLQSCPTLCDPIDGSPPGSRVPGILQARTLEWVAISFSNAWKWEVKVKSLSRVQLLATPWTAAHQAHPSVGFSRQEYWSGVPLPSPDHNFRVLYVRYQKCAILTRYTLLYKIETNNHKTVLITKMQPEISYSLLFYSV